MKGKQKKESQQQEQLPTAALYARVSSDRQDVDLSVAAQLRALRDYADKNGYIVARQYIDEAESGRIADRPQFRKMLDEASSPNAPFKEILVWKFSRFTRKREHAVAFKAMLRRRGIRVVSITEHADDTPTGKLMEAIIESVDEFYSENLAQEVTRGMREAASRGFWVSPHAPFGYRRVLVQDGAKKRPKLELDESAAPIVRRIFDMALKGRGTMEIAKTLNSEGIPSPRGKTWPKNTIHVILTNEVHTGTLVWGITAKDGAPPVRVEGAFPAIVTAKEYRRVNKLLGSRSPKVIHPMRASSPYVLSGLVTCDNCGRPLSASEAKGGRYTYYVCQSLLKRGSGTCDCPRLNSKRFERLIIDQIRENILSEKNVRGLVRLLDEEMDGMAREERERLATIESELADLKQRLDRILEAIETATIEMSDASERIATHRERKAQLEIAAEEARTALAERRVILDKVETIAAHAREMGEFLKTSELTETKAFIRSFVKEIRISPGKASIAYTIPMPDDSPIGPVDSTEMALSGPVMNVVGVSGGRFLRSGTPFDYAQGERGLSTVSG